MSEEEQLQKEWRDIVITKLTAIELEQRVMQKSLSDNVIVANDVKVMKEEIKTIKSDYVSKKEFNIVEKLVYGAAGLILVGVFGALIALVVKK